MKTSPPWSRRRWTQPAMRTSLSTRSGRTWPHQVSRYSLARRAGKPSLIAASLSAATRRIAVAFSSGAPAHQFLGSPRWVDLPLLTGDHVAQRCLAASGQDQRMTRADAVGLLHLALRGAAAEIELGAQAGAAQLCDDRQGRLPAVLLRDHEDPVTIPVRPGGLRVLQRQRDPVHSQRPAAGGPRRRDPVPPRPPPAGGRRRPVELLDQAVVAPATADPGLRPQPFAFELEDGARVVVQPANQGRVDLVGDAVAVEQLADRVEVLGIG